MNLENESFVYLTPNESDEKTTFGIVAANYRIICCMDESDGMACKCELHLGHYGLDAKLVADGDRTDGSNSIASSGLVSFVWHF